MKKQSKGIATLTTYDARGNLDDIEEIDIYTKIEHRHFRKGEFYMSTMELDRLILEKNYNISTLRVLTALKARIDYNNRIKTFTQTEIASEAKTTQSRVSPALSILLKDHIIRKDGRDYYFVEDYIKGAGDEKNKKKTTRAAKTNTHAEERE